MAVQAAMAVVNTAANVAATISGISDMNKRRFYEMNLGLLNYDQREKLEKLVREADSESARQAILQQTIGSANTARIDALGKIQAEKEKTKKTVLAIALVGGIIIIGGLLFIGKRN